MAFFCSLVIVCSSCFGTPPAKDQTDDIPSDTATDRTDTDETDGENGDPSEVPSESDPDPDSIYPQITVNQDGVDKIYNGIYTAEQFMSLSGKGNYILMDDIDFSGVAYKQIKSFNGLLEGNGYAIKNVVMQAEKKGIGDGMALFAKCGATLKDISFINIVLNATADGDCGGTGLISSYFVGKCERVYVSGAMHGTCKTLSPKDQSGVTAEGYWAGALFGYTMNNTLIESVVIDVSLDVGNNIALAIGIAYYTPVNYFFCVQNGNQHGNPSHGGDCRLMNRENVYLTSMDRMIEKIGTVFTAPAWDVNVSQVAIMPVSGYLVKSV
ncbi:MAG: hypothetical protein IJ706_09555 [Clostridia bacterium]|nr:hypothetical protein [Clostridia bacterium]